MEINVKSSVQFTVENEDRRYVFMMPAGAPLGESYDAVFQVLQQILKYARDAAEKAEQKEKEEKSEEVNG